MRIRFQHRLLLAFPALLATLVLLYLPHLQTKHLLHAEGGCPCCKASRSLEIPFSCNLPHLQSLPGHTQTPPASDSRDQHHHDSDSCPLCHMYLSLLAGVTLVLAFFLLPIHRVAILQRVCPVFTPLRLCHRSAAARAPPKVPDTA